MTDPYRGAVVLTTLMISALAAAHASHAADVNAPPPLIVGWAGKGEIGYVMSTGNVDAKSANAKLDAAHTNGPWKDALHLEALYSKSAAFVSGERWAALFQTNYQLTQPLYVFGQLHYIDDKFSGFSYQGSTTAGVGYIFLASAVNKLSAQVGFGYRNLRPEAYVKDAAGNVLYRIPGTASGNAIVTAAVDYEHDFNATTKLTDKLQTESGAANTLLENDLAVQVQMSRRLALSAGYAIHHNSSPPAGVKKMDTLTTLNLVFAL